LRMQGAVAARANPTSSQAIAATAQGSGSPFEARRPVAGAPPDLRLPGDVA
jgi:hypothetical protein